MSSDTDNQGILDFLDGECSPSQARLERELERDPALRERVRKLAEARDSYIDAFSSPSGANPSSIDAKAVERVMALIQPHKIAPAPTYDLSEWNQKWRRRLFRLSQSPAAIAATLLLASTVLFVVLSDRGSDRPLDRATAVRSIGTGPLLIDEKLTGLPSGAVADEATVLTLITLVDDDRRITTFPGSEIVLETRGSLSATLGPTSALRLSTKDPKNESPGNKGPDALYLDLSEGTLTVRTDERQTLRIGEENIDVEAGTYFFRAERRSSRTRVFVRTEDGVALIRNQCRVPAGHALLIDPAASPEDSDQFVDVSASGYGSETDQIASLSQALLARLGERPENPDLVLQEWALEDSKTPQDRALALRSLCLVDRPRSVKTAIELLDRRADHVTSTPVPALLTTEACAALSRSDAPEAANCLENIIRRGDDDSPENRRLEYRAFEALKILSPARARKIARLLPNVVWTDLPTLHDAVGSEGLPTNITSMNRLIKSLQIHIGYEDLGDEQSREYGQGALGALKRFDSRLIGLEMHFNLLATAAANILTSSLNSFYCRRLLKSDEPILWIAGLRMTTKLPDPSLLPAIRRVVAKGKDLDNDETRIKLSAALAGNLTDGLFSAVQDFILGESNPAVRTWLVRALHDIDSESIRELLVQLVNDDSSRRVRFAALKNLANRQDPRTIKPLRDAFDTVHRIEAMAIAAALTSDVFVPEFCGILTIAGSSLDERCLAATALGQFPSQRTFNHLLQAVETSSPRLGTIVGNNIARSGNVASIHSRVIPQLASDTVSAYCKTGILRGLRDRTDELEDVTELNEFLLEALSHENSKLRVAAADVVAQLGNRFPSTDRLLSLLGDFSEPVEVHVSAAKALHAMGDRTALEFLISTLLNRRSVKAGRHVLLGLRDLVPTLNDSTRQALIRRVTSGLAVYESLDQPVRFLALRLLLQLEANVSVDRLYAILDEPRDLITPRWDQVVAALILEKQGDPRGDAGLRVLLSEESVVETLGIGSRTFRDGVTHQMMRQYHDLSWQLRNNVPVRTETLVSIAEDAVCKRNVNVENVDSVKADLSTVSDIEAQNIIDEITSMLQTRAEVVAVLTETMNTTTTPFLSGRAASRLGWIASSHAIRALHDAARDENRPDAVSNAAHDALQRLGLDSTEPIQKTLRNAGADPAMQLRRYRDLLSKLVEGR